MNYTLWGWLILAALFFVAEMFTAGFFLACFAVGCLGAAGLGALGVGLWWQVGAFAVLSLITFFFTRRIAERVTGDQPMGVGIDRVLGKQGLVLETIDTVRAKGMVRVDREEWRAITEDGSVIEAESVIRVTGVDGTKLVVKKEE
ncbi:MAG TPA: NfeD family protein [Thermoanaerobaculia bacterium]|nr:NfeD family protein [Thermoanaerobaculia bacterium]HUM29032.1 NfeD family protein [Thermoanaerobaculia bacterium]HXK67412.1 NfeD family protein [Thermoanaerobaculia bacterium]